MREFLAGIGAAFISLFGMGSGHPPQSVVYSTDQPAAAIVAQSASADPSPTSAGTSTIVNQYITQPVIEREVLAGDAITRAEFDAALAALRIDLIATIQRSLPSIYAIPSPAPVVPVSLKTFAHSQKIDQLANVTISNATLSGVTGLTDADVPDTITASNYLPLSGGTITGDLTMSGTLSAGALSVSSLSSSGALTGPYVSATSTSATSSFAGNVEVDGYVDLATTTITGALTVVGNTTITGSGQLTVGDKVIAPGEIGVGTSTPWGKLSVVNTGTIPSFIVSDQDDDTSPFTIDASGNVGIGTTSPSGILDLEANSPTMNIRANSGAAFLALTSYRNSAITHAALEGAGARGSVSSPSVVQQGDSLLRLSATGWDGTSFYTSGGDVSAEIDFVADETFSTTLNRAGAIRFRTLATGANFKTERMRITSTGNVGIGTSAPRVGLEVAGDVIIASSTNISIVNPNYGGITSGILSVGGGFHTVFNGKVSGASGGTGQLVIGGWVDAQTSGSSFNTVVGPGYVTKIVGTSAQSTVLGYSAAVSTSSRSTAIGYGASVTSSDDTVAIGNSSAGINLGGDFNPIGRLNIKASSTASTGYALVIRDSSNADLLRVTNTGNVGIGTTSPYAKLSVVGPVVAEYFHATSTTATSTFGGHISAGNSSGVQSDAPITILRPGTGSKGGINFYNQSTFTWYAGLLPNATNSFGVTDLNGFTPFSIGADTQSNTLNLVKLISGSAIGGVVIGGTTASAKLDVTSNGTLPAAVFQSGNVGIGTTTPGSLLTMVATSPVLSLASSNNAGDPQIVFGRASLLTTVGSKLWYDNDQGHVYLDNLYDDAAGNIFIRTRAAGTPVNTVSILGTGNVGIGTTTPGQKLVIDSGANGNSIATTFTGGTGRPYWLYDFQQQGAKWSSGFDPTGGTNGFAIRDVDGGVTPFFIGDSSPDGAFRIQSSTGNVGIGTTSPLAKLSVHAKNGETNTRLFEIASSTASATTTHLVVTNAGNVGIATTSPWRTLSVTGTVGFDGLTGATGAGSLCLSANREVIYNSASDACLPSLRDTKHDISSLSVDALSQVLALEPVSFVYNEGDGRTRYGFIAEDTAAVDEHLTTYSASGTLSGIDDRSILAVVVKAIQDLADKITGILDRLAGHDTELADHNAQIAALETRIAALETAQGASAGGAGSPAPEDAEPDTEAPTITLNGNNPAVLQVGDVYSDLGATITDNVDLNLGYETFLGSTPIEFATLDTSEPNEWHIHYVAIDSAGNTATSTRTVIVESPSIVPDGAGETEEQQEEQGQEEPASQ